MRFAIAAIDRYLGVYEAFVHAGWQPLKLFTTPSQHELSNNQAVIAYAEKHNAVIQMSRMTEHDLAELQRQGCEALIVASYNWKIPDWQPYLKCAVNFHSSPLPEGRGPYPIVRAILENRDSWGITCHRLAAEIDKGDILAVERFPLQADESHESLDLKTQMAAQRLAAKVAREFMPLWEQAVPQGEGSYWKKPTLQERIIDFQQPVADILRHIRAFGSTESLANIGGAWLIVKRAVGWVDPHVVAPGQAAHVFNKSIVIAALDGYIGLLESDFAPPEIVAQMQK